MGDNNQQGGESLHVPSREDMQKNKMLLHPLLTRGVNLDPARPCILLPASVS
jgi:hypothetical protein